MDMCYPSQSYRAGEQFHYSLALFLYSTMETSKVFLNLPSPLNKMGAGNKKRGNEGLLLALEMCVPWRHYQQSDLARNSLPFSVRASVPQDFSKL